MMTGDPAESACHVPGPGVCGSHAFSMAPHTALQGRHRASYMTRRVQCKIKMWGLGSNLIKSFKMVTAEH